MRPPLSSYELCGRNPKRFSHLLLHSSSFEEEYIDRSKPIPDSGQTQTSR